MLQKYDLPVRTLWEFEYYNSHYEIDGDEKYHKDKLWIDFKISKEDVIDIITKLYSDDDYFSLRNLKVVDYEPKELKIKYE